MTIIQKLVTEDSFDAKGTFIKAGHIGTFDTEKLKGDEKHIKDVGGFETAVVEIAAIAPTGPNPKVPQQIPPDAVQGAAGEYVLPGKVLVAETAKPAEERRAHLTEPEVEDETSSKIEELMGEGAGNVGNELIEGTVDDVTADLGTKTDAELTAIRAAEVDREKPRKGVLSAIDAELKAREQAATS